MRIGIACFIFGTVIALANAMVRDLGLFPEALGKYVFMTLVIVGMTLIGGGVVFPQRRYIKKKTAKPTAGADNYLAVLTTPLTGLPSADRNVEGFNVPRDPAEPIPVPSVTESTTRNLN
jgi:nitrate reductase gamma subunit